MAQQYRAPKSSRDSDDGPAGAIAGAILAALVLFWIVTHWNRGTGPMALVAWSGPGTGPTLSAVWVGLRITLGVALVVYLVLRVLVTYWSLTRRHRRAVYSSPEFDPRPSDVETVARRLARSPRVLFGGRAAGAYHVHLEARAGQDGDAMLHTRWEAPPALANELRAALNLYSETTSEEEA